MARIPDDMSAAAVVKRAVAMMGLIAKRAGPPPKPPQAFGAMMETLTHLEAEGGHGEASSDAQRQVMAALMSRCLVDRRVYKGGLAIYEITDAGRQHLRPAISRSSEYAAKD